MLKRYIVFMFSSEPSGGWDDVLSERSDSERRDHDGELSLSQYSTGGENVVSFDTAEEAVVLAAKVDRGDIFQVVDLHTGKMVATGMGDRVEWLDR